MNDKKDQSDFRDYSNASDQVKETYKLNHTEQTVNYVRQQINKHCTNFDKAKMTIWKAIEKLDNVVDESDPDLGLPQIVHAFQVAEAIRKEYPDLDWIHLTALIHDLGKIIALPEFGNQPQWSTVGDTFPVGCKFSDKIIYPEYFTHNFDSYHYRYSTDNGMYEPNCGLDNVLFSFGHDEYMYRVCVHNKCKIPDMGLKIIRYHSCYVIHKEHEYEHLMSPEDYEIRDWCSKFSKFDLYTKDNNNVLNVDELKHYYQGLIDKYFPNNVLEW
jgi:inositol oxygenase